MCGRFNNHLPRMLGWAEMLDNWPQISASYNVAPSSTIAAFTLDVEGCFTGRSMRWGLVPSWSKSIDSKYATFNARLETIDEKANFRSAWRHQRRCLIPMAGYYEWSNKVASSKKQPFYVSDPHVGGLVAAGLFEEWRSDAESDSNLSSCTIITRAADPDLQRVHGRMPVLLTPESALRWMKPGVASIDENAIASDTAQKQMQPKQLLGECVKPDIVYWPVDRAVGNVRNNHADLCAAIDLVEASHNNQDA